jgi:hypothetical protein
MVRYVEEAEGDVDKIWLELWRRATAIGSRVEWHCTTES